MRRTMTALEWALSAVSLALALIMTVSMLLWSAVWAIAPFIGIGAMIASLAWWLFM